MLRSLFKRFPASMSMGLVSTGLWIYSSSNPFFFLRNFEECAKYDKIKNKFEGSPFKNILLTVNPLTLNEWSTFMVYLFFFSSRLERYIGYKLLLSFIPINAGISIFSNYSETEKLINPYIYSLPMSWILVNLLIKHSFTSKIIWLSYASAALLILQFDHDFKIGIISYFIIKFLLRYYVKGPIFTYL